MKVIIRAPKVVDLSDVSAAIKASGFTFHEVVLDGDCDPALIGWCIDHGYRVKRIHADFYHYANKAGDVRDAEMVAYADGLIAVYSGDNRYVFSMISRAHRESLETYVFNTEEL